MTPGVTVHLVDDDASYLRATARMLAAEGFPVSAFGSGDRLLAAVTPATRGCVVADLSMPGFDGLQLQAALLVLRAAGSQDEALTAAMRVQLSGRVR